MNKPWAVILQLEADNSRLAKEAIVRREAEAGNTEFFKGCGWAMDSMITFGIKKVDAKQDDGPGLSWSAFEQLATQLSQREVTGNAAITAVNYARQRATAEQWNHWYRRILIKDLRCGVTEKTINNVVAKTHSQFSVPVFTCQLAHDSKGHESKVTGKKLIEVKLDGVRVITVVYPSGAVDQYSRNGKELVNFEHIKQQISRHARFFAEPMVLDGEVMSASFQDLMKQVHRKSDVAANDAVLNLFDIITLKEFQAGAGVLYQVTRSNNLMQWYNQFADHMPNVTVVGQELVDLDTAQGKERFKEINASAIAGGYEGLLIKDPDAAYECKRSVAWLKLKPVISVDLTVMTLEEGTGKNVGVLGALVCEGTDQGRKIKVNVGSGLTDKQRKDMWNNKDLVIGQTVEILADAVTKSQDSETYSLRFPRFNRFRDDK
jgi:DNA ligase-1